MPVLAYAVTQRAVPVTAAGVGDAAINSFERDGLHTYYSDIAPIADDMQADALRFHGVIGDLFRQTTIVPFRFPTLLPTQTELAEFVRDRHALFAKDLGRLEGKIQMEVIVSAPAQTGAESGTAYLQAKLSQTQTLRDAAEQIRSAVESHIVENAEREIQDGARLFFLVRRNQIDSFMQAIARCGVRGLRTTGPWPPTAFLSKELAAAHV